MILGAHRWLQGTASFATPHGTPPASQGGGGASTHLPCHALHLSDIHALPARCKLTAATETVGPELPSRSTAATVRCGALHRRGVSPGCLLSSVTSLIPRLPPPARIRARTHTRAQTRVGASEEGALRPRGDVRVLPAWRRARRRRGRAVGRRAGGGRRRRRRRRQRLGRREREHRRCFRRVRWGRGPARPGSGRRVWHARVTRGPRRRARQSQAAES